jgi:hypothetical protein
MMLHRFSTPESRSQAISSVSLRIDDLLSPFCTSLNPQERLQSLSSIAELVAALSIDLGSQRARFKFVIEPPETPFNAASMEDIYQANETKVDPASGMAINALDGRPILAVIFPSVVKCGNELGESYNQMIVILKARVLT